MTKQHTHKVSRKVIKEKYPVKVTVGEEIVQFTGRLFLVFIIFILVALAADIFHFGH